MIAMKVDSSRYLLLLTPLFLLLGKPLHNPKFGPSDNFQQDGDPA